MAPKTLCLTMIVKTEMANLERCLSAAAPHIACWVIGDTGSTDGTQDFIRSFFAARNIPGELHEFPFVDFSQARNEALKCARASRLHFDYLLLIDADMELTVQDPAFAQGLTGAAYNVRQKTAYVTYWNTRLLRRDLRAIYKGVTHEILAGVTGNTKNLEGISFIDHGVRLGRADKYERDARLLKNAIAVERDRFMIARYTFYLANTLRDGGQKEAALEMYLKRARLGHWQQEVFMSLLDAARLKEALSYSDDEVIAAYEQAAAACPARAEALHGAAQFCRNKGFYERAYQFAAKGLRIAYPHDALFVEDMVYQYGLLDEFAVAAYWTARYGECVGACDRLLNEGRLPTDDRGRVLQNRNLALGTLQELAVLSSPKPDAFVALLSSAREKERLGCPHDEVISAYAEATAACPTRAEALHGAARYCRMKRLYERGYEFAAAGLTIPYPNDAVAIEDWIYAYGLLDEFAVNAYWTGRYRECIDACQRLLNEGKIPQDMHQRVEANARFARDKLELTISGKAISAALTEVVWKNRTGR